MKKSIMDHWRSGRGFIAGSGIATLSVTARAADLLESGMAGSRITAENLDLHLLVMYAVLAIYGLVFGVMLFSMFAHRKAAEKPAGPFHRSAIVEIIWAVVPWAIIFGAAWPAASVLAKINSPANADITIKAMGLQWKWGYQYLEGDGEGISFFSNVFASRPASTGSAKASGGDYRFDVDNPVVVPVGRKIRMVLEANEGIHSWHIPSLGVKQFAIPGLFRDTWFHARETGTYRGLCSAEACGAGRACVLVVVKVVTDGDYRRWVDGRKGSMAGGGRETTVRAPSPVDAL